MSAKKRAIIDYGQGECQYRFCDRPEKKFPKKRDKQDYCCPRHRAAEWNLRNPRSKVGTDAKNQVPLPMDVVDAHVLNVLNGTSVPLQASLEPNKNITIPATGREIANIKWPISKPSPKRKFHYTKIDGKSNRAAILRATLKYLLECSPTTFEINLRTLSTRGSSDVSELREQGFVSECIPCKAADGSTVNRFQLTPEGREKAEKFFREWGS